MDKMIKTSKNLNSFANAAKGIFRAAAIVIAICAVILLFAVLYLMSHVFRYGEELQQLSEKVGVANVNLSKLKNGHVSAIRFSTLEAICDVLDCQPGDILEFQRKKQEK